MFATFLIGLREGLEASLVVSILIAFLVKSDKRRYLWHVWGGVAVAVVLSVVAGAIQTYGSRELTYEGRELFEAIASVIAVCFVTWMIFWMRSAARRIATELRARLADAIALGPFAVVVMAFFAVAREGLETSMMLYSATQATGDGGAALWSAVAGIAVSVAIGAGLYFGAISFDLGRFFTWTGALLVFVAGGILKYAVHDFQEAGALGGLNTHAYDASAWYAADSWYATLLEGMFNVTATSSLLEVLAWFGYVVPVLVAFLWPQRSSTPRSQTPASPAETA